MSRCSIIKRQKISQKMNCMVWFRKSDAPLFQCLPILPRDIGNEQKLKNKGILQSPMLHLKKLGII